MFDHGVLGYAMEIDCIRVCFLCFCVFFDQMFLYFQPDTTGNVCYLQQQDPPQHEQHLVFINVMTSIIVSQFNQSIRSILFGAIVHSLSPPPTTHFQKLC